MALCERCVDLTVYDFYDRPIVFHPDLATLKSKADEGCPFCSLCWSSLLRTANRSLLDKLLRGESAWDAGERWTPTIWLMGAHFHTNGSAGAHIEVCVGKPIQVFGQQEEESNMFGSVSARLEVYEYVQRLRRCSLPVFCFTPIHTMNCRGGEDANEQDAPRRLPGSPSTYRLLGRRSTTTRNPELRNHIIQQWLDNCRKNHPLCQADIKSATMPTRVIDVGTRDDRSQLRLVSTEHMPCEPYIALSYCWGVTADDILTLTAKTFASMRQGIRESDLAQTHRETVVLARALGIRYIWVDALCIIQGDEADWARESKTMAQVYGNATLTVVAGRSADARNGYIDNTLDASTDRAPPPCQLPVGAPPSDGGFNGGFVMISLPRSTDLGPVLARAWCCQERVCCRRAVMFGTEQLIFECETERAYENGLVKRPPAPRFFFDHLSQLPERSDRRNGKDATLRKWYDFLYTYTACHLSDPRDIFAAVGAIAQQAAGKLESRYLAGIWECDIVRGLLWKPCYHLEASANSKIPTTRPKPTRLTGATQGPIVRAPSWSWAAVQGPVSQESGTPPNLARFKDPAYMRVRPARRSPSRWTREEHDERCGPDRLRVPAMELRVTGRLAPAWAVTHGKLSSVSDYVAQAYTGRHRMPRVAVEGVLLVSGEAARTEESWEHVTAIGFFDVREERDKVKGVIYCLLLVQNKGLMLEKSEDGTKFSRLGWFYLENEAWFSDYDETEVYLC
ncbi:heterokaryon incompatibility protein [Purpureocillium lavendulum]|uniref:Heterokaryon incompatibility protein n=1 Tax=Purpureocillium lavendulum TaxID=1247861 RepID=A0AB34FZF5_9HYPO|nr:heterokaryon incompatibility protein [Purpureocillium lavendulum]